MFIKDSNLGNYLNLNHVVYFVKHYTWRKKNDHGYSWRLFTNLGFMSPYRVITVHDQNEVTKINSYLE